MSAGKTRAGRFPSACRLERNFDCVTERLCRPCAGSAGLFDAAERDSLPKLQRVACGVPLPLGETFGSPCLQ